MKSFEQTCRDQVIDEATKRQLEVLNAFGDGLTSQQVAKRLGISVKTVDTYKTSLLALCRNAWDLSHDEKLDYHFLHTKFARTEEDSKVDTQSMVQGKQLRDPHNIPSTNRPPHQLGELSTQECAYCHQVINEATERQFDVLRAFADGLTPQQVADKLVISVKTVDTHKTSLLALCRNAWGLPFNEWLDYRFLNEKFGGFFQPSQTGSAW